MSIKIYKKNKGALKKRSLKNSGNIRKTSSPSLRGLYILRKLLTIPEKNLGILKTTIFITSYPFRKLLCTYHLNRQKYASKTSRHVSATAINAAGMKSPIAVPRQNANVSVPSTFAVRIDGSNLNGRLHFDTATTSVISDDIYYAVK